MNYIKTGILLLVLTVLLIWIGGLVGGARGAIFAFMLALIMNGISYWYSDKIVLAMYRAKEIPEDKVYHLYNIVRELTQSADLPMPKIYMIETKSPNAFATGRNPS